MPPDPLNPPRVMGLDLSLTGTGIVHPNGQATTVRTKPADGDDVERIRLIRNRVIRTAIEDDVQLVVVENMSFGSKGSAVHALAGLAYAVRLELRHTRTRYTVVAAGQLKKFATGKGNADKTAMALALQARAGLVLGNDNETDAWWLRAMGMAYLGSPVVELPKAHLEVLAKVTWPQGLTSTGSGLVR